MAKRTTKAKAAAPAAAPIADAGPSATAPTPAPATPPAATRDEAPSGDLTRVMVASLDPKGRRRAGQSFGPEPVELHVTDATLELLEGDPQLVVKRG
jgi:hypothetical protein